MKTTIVSFDPATGQLLVNYATDAVPAGIVLAIDVPIENGVYQSGAVLQDMIDAFAPVEQLGRMAIAKSCDPGALAAFVPPPPPPPPSGNPFDGFQTLDEALQYARGQIDRAASDTRLRFISGGAGQAETYLLKAQQARAYREAGYTGTVPPFLAAEAAAVGITPAALADTVIALNTQWADVIGPAIEALRIGGKRKLESAVDIAAVEALMRSAIMALQTFVA